MTSCWERSIANVRDEDDAGSEAPRREIDPRLHVELWTSWASLLRSYAGAHGLNSPRHAVVEVGPEEIVLRVDTRWLRFTHHAMKDSSGHRTAFSLGEDGTARLGEITEEMDMAAERLAREMMGQ